MGAWQRGAQVALAAVVAAGASGCGGGGSEGEPADPLDTQLRTLIVRAQLTGDPVGNRVIPSIDAPLTQLGMRLFFSKSLSGAFDSSCASCHHPALAGTDLLSLSAGTGVLDAAVTGPGRQTTGGAPNVPRNSPTTFNVGLFNTVLFHDGRIEQEPGGIRTPDVAFDTADPNAGPSLLAAQSRFPVTVDAEMRGGFLPGATTAELRDRLAQRLGNYGAGTGELARNDWLPLFQAAFGAGTATDLVTYANVAAALAAYQQSQSFVASPWNDYVGGDLAAIAAPAKRGAILFLSRPDEGGAGCSACHRADHFTDELPHAIGFPQIGPGKGDGPTADDDFGRARESGAPADRYRYRTASLLNVGLTAPYGHAGAYATLNEVVRHYVAPGATSSAFLANSGWCALAQFAVLPPAQCQALYPNAAANSDAALQKALQDRGTTTIGIPAIALNPAQVADVVAFLQALTDPCAQDRACVADWIPPDDGGPDDQQLLAVDGAGAGL